MSVTRFYFAKNVIDRGLRQQIGGMTEMLGRGTTGKGADRPEEGYPQRLFQRQTSRHHLTEKEGDVLAGQRAGVGFLQPAQYLRLAFGSVDVPRFAVFGLDLANLLRATGALVEQPEKFGVENTLPIKSMMTVTKASMTFPNAPPMTTAIARSTTLPEASVTVAFCRITASALRRATSATPSRRTRCASTSATP